MVDNEENREKKGIRRTSSSSSRSKKQRNISCSKASRSDYIVIRSSSDREIFSAFQLIVPNIVTPCKATFISFGGTEQHGLDKWSLAGSMTRKLFHRYSYHWQVSVYGCRNGTYFLRCVADSMSLPATVTGEQVVNRKLASCQVSRLLPSRLSPPSPTSYPHEHPTIVPQRWESCHRVARGAGSCLVDAFPKMHASAERAISGMPRRGEYHEKKEVG